MLARNWVRTSLIFCYNSFLECNKDLLIDILTQRSNAQRQMIAGAYQSMYGRVRLLHFDLFPWQVPEHQHPSRRNEPITSFTPTEHISELRIS